MSNKVAKRVDDDKFIVANNVLTNVISFIKDPSKLIYWSQGALASLFMWSPFTQGGSFKEVNGFLFHLTT